MPQKLPEFLLDDEPERLLRATQRQFDRLLCMVMLYQGLRVSEACRLRIEHLDFRRRLLFVREGKGKKDRALPIVAVLVGPLRGLIGSRRTGWVFCSRRGGHIKPRAVQLLMKRLAVRADLTNATEPRRITPHKWRHAMATRMIERGADIIAVRDALGHASVSTSQIYTHCSPDRLRSAMEV